MPRGATYDDPKSLAEKFAGIPEAERESVLTGLDLEELMYDPEFWLRPTQLEAFHATEWMIALISGRGFGKNHTISEWVRDKARTPATRISLTGRTVADVRDTIVQGPSGILSMHPPSEIPEYFPSVRKLVWPNGSVGVTFSADAPSQLRGPAFHYAVADELAAWKHTPDDSGATAFDHIQIGTRLGDRPQIMIATTPKRVQVVKDIVAQAETSEVLLVTGTTMENATNLPPDYIDRLRTMYAGTALERQEIYGELLLVVEEALWLEKDIRQSTPPAKTHRVVSVDPGVTTGGDATGIVVVYSSTERRLEDRTAWVVDDRTVTGAGPDIWAEEVVQTWKDHSPAVVIVESNQGGELVESVIKQIDASVPIATVHASKSKAARAEPVVLAYRRGNAFHDPAADLDELEEEMLTWEPASKWSPNRMDACLERGSLVETDSGQVPIEQLAPGDLVHTRQGLRPVVKAWMVDAGRRVFEVVLSNGNRLRATGDHLVATEDGWTRVDALVHGARVVSWNSTDQNTLSAMMATGASKQSGRIRRFFTEMFGSSITDRSRPGVLSTTSTTTSPTMTSRISQRLLGKSTRHSTRTAGHRLHKRSLPQQNGTDQKPVEPGTENMENEQRRIDRSSQTLVATAARQSSSSLRSGEQRKSSALESVAGSLPGINLLQIENAEDAEQSSTLEAPPSNSALSSVESVTTAGRAEVWDVEVEDVHEFVANGIVVHNCVHGIRALLVDDTALRKYAGVHAGTKASTIQIGMPTHLRERNAGRVPLGSWRGKNRG